LTVDAQTSWQKIGRDGFLQTSSDLCKIRLWDGLSGGERGCAGVGKAMHRIKLLKAIKEQL